MPRKKSDRNTTQFEDYAIALAENAAILLFAAEQLGMKTKIIQNYRMDEQGRAIVANLPSLAVNIKEKLCQKDATFTVAEIGGMVMAVADRLLDAEPKENGPLLAIAKELMDCLQENFDMSELPSTPRAPHSVLQFIHGGRKNKLKLGKGCYFVKSQLRRLRQDEDIWEADFFPLPQQSVWIGLVINQFDDFVLAHRTIHEPPTVNDLADLLAEAMRRPLAKFSRRPRTLYIRARPEWNELLTHLKQVGIEVVSQDSLPKWDDVFSDLYPKLEAESEGDVKHPNRNEQRYGEETPYTH